MTIENKKFKAAVAICLLLPLVFIGFFAARLVTGTAEFRDVKSITVQAPDGSTAKLTEKEDLRFYTELLENAEFISKPVRELKENEAASVLLDDVKYTFYLSQSPSGCMVGSADGRLRLISSEDAVKLLVRDEIQYLYAGNMLPTLEVCSGEFRYEVLPDDYEWQYKKADDRYYIDTETEKSSAPQQFNLYSDFTRDLRFSVVPSHYSLSITRVNDQGETVDIMAGSLADLSFRQDTVLTVEIDAKWSQASGATAYGEASYRFRILYDVPAMVDLRGAQAGSLTVTTGDLLILTANYTNENEILKIDFEGSTPDAVLKAGNLKFWYDEDAHTSYAIVPIAPETEEGEYTMTVTSGNKKTEFFLNVRDGRPEKIRTITLPEEDYRKYASPDAIAELDSLLADFRTRSEGRSLMTATSGGQFTFGAPCAGEPSVLYQTTVMFRSENMGDDSGMRLLPGVVYEAKGDGEVRAVQSGVVLFAGELGAAGNAVIVSHGMGVCSYYFHLSEISVHTGDQLEYGATVGKAGQTGLTQGKDCLQFMLSAGDVYFRP